MSFICKEAILFDLLDRHTQRLLALAFSPRFDDARVREALALAVDRTSIHRVLLQRQGEVSGSLLPQWLSGYAFLFPDSADLARARALMAGRYFVTPQDLKDIAHPILRHRLRLSYEAEAQNLTTDDIINRILETLHVP